ncbi:MAG: TonB family protein [Candidatus Sulfotelmatobacter sp.]
MGYSALLFCPEEKTARTVTQVLSELEFTVEACTEPFVAVKKLMGQHFDAVVVDCDNEQNATLLFKSARNSTSNQTSLAVAVVEGQAGVAKAFRIGANLVLTKPINIEQSKGTLRVARGLLRKGEPARPTTPPASPAVTAPVKPVASAVPDIKAAAPVATPLTTEPTSTPVVKPTPAWPAPAAVASTVSPAHDDDLLEVDAEEPKKPVAQPESHPAMNLFSAPSAAPSAGGAASGTAPARERTEAAPVEKALTPPPMAVAPPIETGGRCVVGSAPSFTFGGMNVDGEESSGSGKKIILGIAAAVIVAAGLYVGITHFSGATGQPATTDAASAGTPANVAHAVASTPKTTAAEKPSATLPTGSQLKVAEPNKVQNIIDETAGDTHAKTADDEQSESTPEPAPLMVKGGKITKALKGADAPAPSMIGMATPDATAPPANLVPSASPSLRPTLSTLHVSQGVSTGLLIKKVAPSYPSNALRMRVEGDVDLVATISKEGNISSIKVTSGDPQLTKAAVDAVKQWKYKPYLLNGEPVEIQTQVTIKFKLPR